MTTIMFADTGNPDPNISDVLDSDAQTEPIILVGGSFVYGHIRMVSLDLVGTFYIEMSVDGSNFLPIPGVDSEWPVAGGKFIMDAQHRIFQFPAVKGRSVRIRFEHTSGEASFVEAFLDADRSGMA